MGNVTRGACGEVFDDISKSIAISAKCTYDLAKMGRPFPAKPGKTPGAGNPAAYLPEIP